MILAILCYSKVVPRPGNVRHCDSRGLHLHHHHYSSRASDHVVQDRYDINYLVRLPNPHFNSFLVSELLHGEDVVATQGGCCCCCVTAEISRKRKCAHLSIEARAEPGGWEFASGSGSGSTALHSLGQLVRCLAHHISIHHHHQRKQRRLDSQTIHKD